MDGGNWAGGLVLILLGVAILGRTLAGTGTSGGSHLVAFARRVGA